MSVGGVVVGADSSPRFVLCLLVMVRVVGRMLVLVLVGWELRRGGRGGGGRGWFGRREERFVLFVGERLVVVVVVVLGRRREFPRRVLRVMRNGERKRRGGGGEEVVVLELQLIYRFGRREVRVEIACDGDVCWRWVVVRFVVECERMGMGVRRRGWAVGRGRLRGREREGEGGFFGGVKVVVQVRIWREVVVRVGMGKAEVDVLFGERAKEG